MDIDGSWDQRNGYSVMFSHKKFKKAVDAKEDYL